MTRRSWKEIKIAMLQAVIDHPNYSYTQLLAIVNANSSVGQGKFKELLHAKLIEAKSTNPRGSRYQLTEEGKLVLRLWKEVKERLEP